MYTVKTPDVEFRTYDRMPQDQTVHRAEHVSGLWAAKIQLNIRSFPLFSELSEDFPEVSEVFPDVSEGFFGWKLKEVLPSVGIELTSSGLLTCYSTSLPLLPYEL
jgi:hypothetical protein